ncbi:hypothetical protein MSPP1_002840 [Malassezia sp. CBS 17886]|nr:hypothetical protein MSPP1_002840 [Malassezia sp. CBS 17886]
MRLSLTAAARSGAAYAAAASAPAQDRPMKLLRLPASALHPPLPAVDMRARPTATYSSELFSLRVYPLRGLAQLDTVRRTPSVFGPPWLPYPPTRATHEARHFRRRAAAQALAAESQGRSLPRGAGAQTPRLLRTTVFVSKKRVHKLAVVRSRCRTRLLGALRTLLRAGNTPADERYAYIFAAAAGLYACDMGELQEQLSRALVAVSARLRPPAAPHAAPRGRPR